MRRSCGTGVLRIKPPLKGPKPEISVGFFYCFEFSISRKCLGFFYFRTKFGILAWVLLVNLSNNLTWFLLVNLTKNAQNFPALRAESVGVLLLFCEISPKKVGVLLLKEGVFILNTPVHACNV